MQDLQNYRNQIDQIDAQIIELLSKRLEVVKKVGEYKKENNLPPLQAARWQEVLSSKMNLAQEKGLNPEFVKNIWEEIHKEALRLENNII